MAKEPVVTGRACAGGSCRSADCWKRQKQEKEAVVYTLPSKALKQRSVPLAKGAVCPKRFSSLQSAHRLGEHSSQTQWSTGLLTTF